LTKSETMETGQRGNYFWLDDASLFIGDLLRLIPEVVVGKYLIVTSFDSGPLRLENADFQRGWLQHDELAINPSVMSTGDMPYDEWDEWYVFRKPPLLEDFAVFVNYGSFCLQDPAQLFAEGESSELLNLTRDLQRSFWDQLELKAPESYVACGNRLMVATRSPDLYEGLVELLAPLSQKRASAIPDRAE
jgi:hypothetical protein